MRELRGVDTRDLPGLIAALAELLEGRGPALAPEGAPAGPAATVPAGVDLVVSTSGSTGIPKRIAHSRHALLASARATEEVLGGPGTWVLALPAHYIAGLQVLIRSHVAGTSPESLPGGIFDPAEFAAATERAAARSPRLYTSLVPAQVERLLDENHAASLARYSAVLVGGQFTPGPLRARAAAADITLVRTYGSSETGGGCVYDGHPLPGVIAESVGGEILLGGPTLARGYLDAAGGWDHAATARALSGTGDDRRFHTGDAGTVSADAGVSITGRRDNVLISGGINVSLDRIENLLRGLPGLSPAVVVAAPDARWGQVPVLVLPAGEDPDAALLALARAECERVIGVAARPARLIRVEKIPLLSSGKPDRRGLTARIAALPPTP
ncbi:AMP-binding protein [Mycetocola spongiae]|uniref:AMP-binding protein n=1 Tax=Mycetocola spongiae TaxID=2859226 RepID=UPI001CF2BAE3|nr:AMP-binding protein [Mycetocola spongiae]